MRLQEPLPSQSSFFSIYGDRIVCDEDKDHTLASKPIACGPVKKLAAPEGYRFWSGGDPRWEHRETFPYLVPPARFVPMVLNHERTDDAKLCRTPDRRSSCSTARPARRAARSRSARRRGR